MKSVIFNEIIGHQKQISLIEKQLQNDRSPHAFLFYGPVSVGKFTLAKTFARSLLCENSSIDNCPSCHSFLNQIHPDYLEMKDDGKIIPIANIRKLKKELSFLPSISQKKVVVIEEASNLAIVAQNALLKTLEEPPSYVTLILVSSRDQLVPTILSRVLRINFFPVTQSEAEAAFIKKDFSGKEAKFIAHICHGQIGKVIGDPDFKTKWQESFKLLYDLINSSLKIKMDYAKNANSENIKFWTLIFRDILLEKAGPKNDFDYPTLTKKYFHDLLKRYDKRKVYSILKKLQRAEELSKTSVSKRLLFENLMLIL